MTVASVHDGVTRSDMLQNSVDVIVARSPEAVLIDLVRPMRSG